MWVRFTSDFDFVPAVLRGRVAIAYKTGMRLNVTRECADAALASGKAEKSSKEPRNADADRSR